LTGLPVLGFLQFMGGVEPALVLASFAALALTALSLGGLGLACAVFVKKPQNAAWRAYQIVVLYAALSLWSIWYWQFPTRGPAAAWAGGGRVVFVPGGGTVVLGGVGRAPSPPLVAELNSANPYFAYLRLKHEQDAGTLLANALPAVLRDYALGHG